jgi:histidine kinase
VNRLGVRLVVSHLLAVLVGAVATFVIVRALAPALFENMVQQSGMGMGMGRGQGGTLRQQMADAVTQALLVGTVVGLVAAAGFGAVAAHRLVRSLRTVGAATRAMAGGRYAVPVPVPPEAELAELATDVNTLGHALAETETRRVRLIGDVAHEMRTPLTVIEGYVEGMIDGVIPTTSTELGQVGVEVQRLRRLAQDLSSLSRAEEGRTALQLATVDLRDVVSAAVERLRPQALDAGVSLATTVAPEPVTVVADPDRCAQVVTNLVGNAIRATPPGGRIEVRVRATGGQAVCEVEDTGEGLAAGDLEAVFERFYRVPGRREAPGGSGIGLTIARELVRAHGGELIAASPGPGRGATFTARVPMTGPPAGAGGPVG